MAHGLGSLASPVLCIIPPQSQNCIEASSFLDGAPVSGTASPLLVRREDSEGGEDMYDTRQASPSRVHHSAYKECLMLSYVSHFNAGT